MDIIRAQEQSKDLHEQFHNQVTWRIECILKSTHWNNKDPQRAQKVMAKDYPDIATRNIFFNLSDFCSYKDLKMAFLLLLITLEEEYSIR